MKNHQSCPSGSESFPKVNGNEQRIRVVTKQVEKNMVITPVVVIKTQKIKIANMATTRSGISIKKGVKTRVQKRNTIKIIMIIFVIGVEKKGVGQISAVQVNKRQTFIKHKKRAKERILSLIPLMNQILQVSFTLMSLTSSRTQRWRIDHLISDGSIPTNEALFINLLIFYLYCTFVITSNSSYVLCFNNFEV